MMEILLQWIVLLSALVIILRAEPQLNRMQRGTPFPIRLSFHAVTVGSVAALLYLYGGWVPSPPSALIISGTAMRIFFERRTERQRQFVKSRPQGG